MGSNLAIFARRLIVCPLGPRFNSACPSSPAAALQTPPTNAGTCSTVTCAWARSRSAPACRPGKILGAGHAASIPAAIPANARTAPRPRSPRPAPTSRQRGGYFCQNRTEADFQAWRDQRDWTAEKYRRFDRGERMPPDLRRVADRGWKRRFEEPIPLLRGRLSRMPAPTSPSFPRPSTKPRGVAGSNGSLDPGGDVGRTDDVRAHRRDAGVKSSR
jgi:hypothetical protein